MGSPPTARRFEFLVTLGLLSTARTVDNTRVEHAADHNELHRVYNLATGVVPEVTMDSAGAAAANLAAMKAAVAYAISTGKPLLIPAGTLYIDFANSVGNRYLDVTGNLEVWGAGQGKSIIQAGPEAPVFVYNIFSCIGTAKVRVRDVTLRGPVSPGTLGDSNQATSTFAHAVGTDIGGGSLTLERVTIDGKFMNNIDSPSGASNNANGTYTINLFDCDLTGYAGNVSIFYNTGNCEKTFNAYRTIFRESGIPSSDPGYPYGHSCYFHPGVNYHFEGCEWITTRRYLMHNYGGAADVPKFQRFINCYVGPSGAAEGILIGESGLGLFECRGGSYKGVGGFKVNCSMTFEGTSFDVAAGGTAVGTYDASFPATGIAKFIGCTFTKSSTGGGWGIAPRGAAGAQWLIDGCTFEAPTGAHQYSMISGGSANTEVVHISNCKFIDTSGSSTGVWMRGRICTVRGCSFDGFGADASAGAVSIDQTNLTTGIVENNDFRVTAASAILNNGTGTGKVRGGNNTFTNNKPSVSAGYELLTGRPGIQITAVASGATVTVDAFNYDTFHISGTTDIDNLAITGGAAALRAFAGKVFLIFDSTAATKSGGNIRPKSTSARTANEMACFQYDPSTALFYEVA